jgi:ribosomal protein S3AE
MAAPKKQLLKIKRKKKRWFPIVAPSLFSNVVLGQSLVSDASLLEKKYMTVNLMNITGDAKKQNINVQFAITNVTDGKGQAAVTRFEMLPSSVKRMVRRGRDKVEDSFAVKCTDGKVVEVKPIIITNSNTYDSVQTALRLSARHTLVTLISQYTYEKLLDELFSFRLQKHLKDTLNKIYPVRNCGIRTLALLSRTPRHLVAPGPEPVRKRRVRLRKPAAEKPKVEEAPPAEETI